MKSVTAIHYKTSCTEDMSTPIKPTRSERVLLTVGMNKKSTRIRIMLAVEIGWRQWSQQIPLKAFSGDCGINWPGHFLGLVGDAQASVMIYYSKISELLLRTFLLDSSLSTYELDNLDTVCFFYYKWWKSRKYLNMFDLFNIRNPHSPAGNQKVQD